MLEVKNITKIYSIGSFGSQQLKAVENVSFTLTDGEVISLIGESGSGKTTIGKMILHLLKIDKGSIIFNNQDVSQLKGRKLKEYYRYVQGVFQDPFSSFNPIFKTDRIFKIIKKEYFPSLPQTEWSERIEKALSAVGLNSSEVLNKYPHQLSGGQLQRFLIARALLLEVKLLVADEIISMLDASTRIDVLNLLGDLKKLGLSILFITHDLSLGYYIGEKAVILYRGQIMEMGSTDQVFFNPLHPYTKMLLESVPRLDRKWKEFNVAERNAHPEGDCYCLYYARCPWADKAKPCPLPNLLEIEAGHYVACDHC